MDTATFYALVEAERARLGLSQADVSRKVSGRNDSSVIQTLRRGSSPTLDTVDGLCRALGFELYIGPPRDPEKDIGIEVDGSAFTTLPLIGAQVAAGAGGHNGGRDEVEKVVAFRRDWLRNMGVQPSKAVVVRVRGDSMAPNLRPGDLALIDRGRDQVKSGRVYALNDRDGSTRIKRLDAPEKGTLILRSDNTDFAAELRRGADLGRMTIVGEVIWSGHEWR